MTSLPPGPMRAGSARAIAVRENGAFPSPAVPGAASAWAGIALVLAAALSTALLLAPALWNRFALLQYDTGGYLARWYEGTLVPSRPGAYGLLLAAAAPLHFWPVLVLQAALTVWVLALILRTHGYAGRPSLLLGLVALLSVVTSLPWLTSILLTDIFVGLAVLALHLVVIRADALSRLEQAGLMALVAVSVATHSATFVVLAALVALATLARFMRPGSAPRGGLGRGVIALGLGIALTFTANFAVSGRVAWTPGGAALSFGRMMQDGIVKRYLDDHCPNPQLKLCAYRNVLPRDADVWFWASPLFDRLGRFAGLGQEMQTIALGSLAQYPLLQAKAAVAATAKQLVLVGTGEGVLNSIWHSYAIIEKFTPSVVRDMRAARQQRGEIDFVAVNMLHVPIAIAAMLGLPFVIWLGRRRRRFGERGRLARTAAAAILVNAAICGVLSNPHHRYGARIVWIAVLVVAMAPLRERMHGSAMPDSRSSALIEGMG